MLFLISLSQNLKEIVENNAQDSVVLALAMRKDTSVKGLFFNGKYKEICEGGIKWSIPEEQVLGCYLYGYKLSESGYYDEAIRYYKYAIEGIGRIDVKGGVRVPISDEKEIFLSADRLRMF